MAFLSRIAAAEVVAAAFDLAQRPHLFPPIRGTMTKPDDQRVAKERKPKPSRLEAARRVIEEYANDLRKIIEKLRRKMN
jgi:hypothetical protein